MILTATDTDTPLITSVTFKWTDVSNVISSAIDAVTIPTGWGLFVASGTGTISYFVRTATTAPGLSAASFVAVTNLDFITADVHRFTQWKVIITATADNLPVLSSVTINWFLGTGHQAIRVASLFFDRTYFLATSLFGSDHNDILYKFDHQETWKRDEDIEIATLTLFFNVPYYGHSTDGYLVLFNNGATDLGDPIAMDIRFPVKVAARTPMDLDDKIKLLKDAIACVKGTGAAYSFFYSVDQGATWVSLYDVETGLTSYTPPADNKRYFVRLAPKADIGDHPYGRVIWLRLTETSAFPSSLQSMKIHLLVRNQQVLHG
jgi:hypothetical protein